MAAANAFLEVQSEKSGSSQDYAGSGVSARGWGCHRVENGQERASAPECLFFSPRYCSPRLDYISKRKR